MPTAVLVTTACGRIAGSDRRTGLVLSELGAAHEELDRQGWQTVLASPRGGEVPVDAGSLSEEWAGYTPLAADTADLRMFSAQDPDAWFVLGGHGALFDLLADPQLLAVLQDAVTSGQPVGAVDHGSAVLGVLRHADGRPLLAGRRLTGRSDQEERRVGHHFLFPRTTERTLRAAGALYTAGDAWRPHVVRDGALVTGQNPASTALVAGALTAGRVGSRSAA
jgi:putative intracellular protease/amidase